MLDFNQYIFELGSFVTEIKVLDVNFHAVVTSIGDYSLMTEMLATGEEIERSLLQRSLLSVQGVRKTLFLLVPSFSLT